MARPFRFPAISWAELPGGIKVATVPVKGLPMVHVRVVVGAGKDADGERPGLAAATGELLREGGRLGALGADLSIDTGFDATTIRLAVTREHLGEALDQLAATVQRPQLNAGAQDRVQKREAERLASAARADGAWGASMILHRDLFSLPAEHHPYASFRATPDEAQKITLADCRAFHRRFYVPRNVFVVVAGDATPDAVRALAGKAFAGFTGGEAPALSFTDPESPERRKITLVNHPGSAASEIFVGALGPARDDRAFASFAVASQILGGAAGRLSADLRDKRGIADAAGTALTELAHGPSVLVAHARTRAASTALALQALLEHAAALSEKAPDPEEVEAAERSLAGGLAVRLQTAGALAGELARIRTLGLPDDAHEALRKELGEITPALALKAAEAFRAGHEIIVVAGDASVVGPVLARFGEVKVVDPTRGFARVRTLPMDTGAPREPPRQAGR